MFVIIVINSIKNQKFNFLAKLYGVGKILQIKVYVFKMLYTLITLLISNKKEFNHFFNSRSSDIVLLKLGNLHQNVKRYEARNTEREAGSSHIHI